MEQQSVRKSLEDLKRRASRTLASLAIIVAALLFPAAGARAEDTPASPLPFAPTWLPARFSPAPHIPPAGSNSGLIFTSSRGDVLELLAGIDTESKDRCAQIRSQEALTIIGNQGTLIMRDCAPRIEVRWVERGQVFSIRADNANGDAGVTREEMLRIVAGLQAGGQVTSAATTGIVDERLGQLELKLALLAVIALALIALERPALLRRLAAHRH